MRGKILSYDAIGGEGLITGDDFLAYRFTSADVISGQLLKAGQQVDFTNTADGLAQNVVVVTTSTLAANPGTFDFGRVIQRTFTSIPQNWQVFFLASAILVGIPSVLTALGMTSISQGMFSPRAFSSSAGGLLGIGGLLYVIGNFILQGVVIKAAVNGFTGKKTPLSDAFDVGLKLFFPLLGLAIVMFFGTMVGLVLLIVPGIILAIMWSVASATLVVERQGVFASLQRSRDLTRGYRWQIFGLLLLFGLLSSIISAVCGGVIGGAAAAAGGISRINVVVTPISNIIAGVITAAGAAALYYELRTAKEGIGADELAAVFD